MSDQRNKLYQSYVASDIFYKDGRNCHERRLLDKKIRVNARPKDVLEFRQDCVPENLKTGKRFEEKKKTTSDIFFLQNKMNDNNKYTPFISSRNIMMYLPKETDNISRNSNQLLTEYPNRTSYQDTSITLQSAHNQVLTTRRIKVRPRIQWRSQNSIENQKYNSSSTSRDNKINMLRSNIFFEKKIVHNPINLHRRHNSMDNNNRNRSQEINRDIYQNKKWIDKIDWKTCNTEIHFKEPGKLHNSISAFERKLRENSSDLSPKKFYKCLYRSSLDCKKQYDNINDNISDKKKMNNLFSSYTSNAAKINKQFENYSHIQGRTCFEKNNSTEFRSSIDNEGNQVDTYQISNVDVMQEAEIQRLFLKKGIHMFDIYRKNSINSGHPLLEFKLRYKVNDIDFNNKLNRIKSQIGLLNGQNKLILEKKTKKQRRDCTKVTMPREFCHPKSSLKNK